MLIKRLTSGAASAVLDHVDGPFNRPMVASPDLSATPDTTAWSPPV